MADDDTSSSADPGQPGSPGDPNVPSDAPQSGYPDVPAPKALPAQPDSQKPEDPLDTTYNSMLKSIEELDQRAQAREQDIRSKMLPEINRLQGLVNQPDPAPPQPYGLAQPPSEQQKGGLAEFTFNLLKFGALMALAFGARGRAGGSMAKLAVGSALEGWAKGRQDVTRQSMQLYEKNRQYMNDLNREQNQEYHNILQDRRLALSQQMDLINMRAKYYGDLNTADAARRADLKAVLDKIDAQRKVQRDKEKEDIRHRDKLYEVIGTKNFTAQYVQWLHEQSGGKVSLTINSDPDEWYKVEREHPEWSVAAYQKILHEQELKRAEELSRAKKEGTEESKKPQEDKSQDEHDKAAADALKNDLGF